MRLKTAVTHHVPGWIGGVREDSEPDVLGNESSGALDDGLNMTSVPGGRLTVRGGSVVVRTFSSVAGQAINNVLGLFRYSPVGCVAVGHASAAPQHYAYTLTDTCGFALPAGAGTEVGSRVAMVWASATPARPYAAELFEKLYIVDAAVTGRQNMAVLSVPGGVPTITNPVYDLDGSGAGTAGIAANCVATYNGVIFVSGYDSETGGLAKHLVRHSFLGRDPAAATGFDPDAYAVIGSLNVSVTAMVAGNSVLLVAKENELYRISGTGKGVAGWQYAISSLDNTLGLGCTNPYALCHASGLWYGVSGNGPWRSNGQSVELLNTNRYRSWAYVSKLELAQAVYDPERDKVLFGFYVLGRSVYGAAPFQWWKWDIRTQTWDPDDRYALSFWMAAAVPVANTVAPANPPSAITQSFSFADPHETKVTGTFAAGDVFAMTEVWAYSEGGTTALVDTLPAGVQRFTVDVVAGKIASVKLRHKKGGVLGDFSGEVQHYPKLKPPLLTVDINTNTRYLEATTYFDSGNMVASGGTWGGKTWTNIAAGKQSIVFSEASAPNTWSLYAERTTWPVSHTATPTVTELTFLPVDPPGAGGTVTAPTQVFSVGLQLTTLAVVWCPYTYNDQYVLEYRVSGGGGYTTAVTYTTPNTPGFKLDHQQTTITGLTASTKYDVRVRRTSGLVSPSAATVCYTKLASPTTVAATTNGTPGVPVSNVAVTMPIAGRDVRLYNAAQTYSQLFAAHAVGPTNHVSNAGTCGTGDRYYACMTDTTWPARYQFSDPTTDTVDDPCTVGV